MLNTLFHIQQPGDDLEKVLAICAGERHLSYAVTDPTASSLYDLKYAVFDEPVNMAWNEEEFTEFLSSFPGDIQGKRVTICYDFPYSQVILNDPGLDESTGSLLEILTGSGKTNKPLTRSLKKWNMTNHFSAPAELVEFFDRRFPGAVINHAYSLALESIVPNDDQQLIIDFTREKFNLVALDGKKLCLAQAVNYTSPADVLYYLLKACRHFSLSQLELKLELSGLIDRQSLLFKELDQYFANVSFRESTWKNNGEHPLHFFTTLNAQARCAS